MRMVGPMLPFLFAMSVFGQSLHRLPDWAEKVATAAVKEATPADVDAWVLLDRTEIAYTGDGEIRQRRLRLVKVLTERGLHHAVFTLHGLGGKATRIKRLKGWNLRPDGELVTLDDENVITRNDATQADFSTDTATHAVLDRVVKGSHVAFESQEIIQSPLGPISQAMVLEGDPIRCWELEAAKKEGWFTKLREVDLRLEPRHFAPWIPSIETIGTGGMRLTHLPSLPRGERACPHPINVLPQVQVRFLDPALPHARMWGSWDEVARWAHGHYVAASVSSGVADTKGLKELDGLRALWDWMLRSLVYKQVYLSPERGWVPETAAEVGRKRYGDCKDLTAFFLAEAKRLGYGGFPALSRIVDGYIDKDQPPSPVFNHVISALRIEQSLGLAAEVETPRGRFLLVDPTDLFTPLGRLGSAHGGRRVMLCLPEGAVWVEVPSKAIQPERMDVQIDGDVQKGGLKGTMTLREEGDCWGLRALAHREGIKALRKALLEGHFGLPADGALEVVSTGDPCVLGEPFRVEIRFEHPAGFRKQGSEWNLMSWGMPFVPAPIQQAGEARRYPVWSLGNSQLTYKSVVRVAEPLVPVTPELQGDSAFRTFTFKVDTQTKEGGTRIECVLNHRLKPAMFDFEAREQGVHAWKKDRLLVKSLLENGLAFQQPRAAGNAPANGQ